MSAISLIIKTLWIPVLVSMLGIAYYRKKYRSIWKFLDTSWVIFTSFGFYFLTEAVTGISAYPTGRARGGCALWGKVENGQYYFGFLGDFVQVSHYLYVKSATYTMLAALFICLSMLFFEYTAFAPSKIRCMRQSDKVIYRVIIILVGCYFFFKSLSCLVKA